MNWVHRHSINLAFLIHRFSKDIEDTSKGGWTNRNHNRCAGCECGDTALKTVSCIHSNGAHPVITDMLLDLQNKRFFPGTFNLNCFEKLRNVSLGELHIHHTTQNLYDTACCVCHDFPPVISR